MVFSTEEETEVVMHLNGALIEHERMYRIATWNNTLQGVNGIQPLFLYVREKNTVPDDDV